MDETERLSLRKQYVKLRNLSLEHTFSTFWKVCRRYAGATQAKQEGQLEKTGS